MGTVIFDLDGTLADTSGDLIAAANACLAEHAVAAGLDPARDAATAFRGGRAMLRLGLARAGWQEGAAREAWVDAAFERFLTLYDQAIDVHTRLYPGVEAALEGLAGQGYGLAICTNKPEGLARKLVDRLGIAARFGALVGADTLPTRKPDAAPVLAALRAVGGAPARAVMVGDTVTDREAARNAGLPCLLVTFGPEGEGVAALAPEGLLPDYSALAAEVARLIGPAGRA